MNDTAISWYRRLYAKRGWAGLLLGLTAVKLVGAGPAEATDGHGDVDATDSVAAPTAAPRSEAQRLIVWFGDAT